MTSEDASAAADGSGARHGHSAAAAVAPAVVQLATLKHLLLPLSLFRLVQVEVVFDFENFSPHSRRHVHLRQKEIWFFEI